MTDIIEKHPLPDAALDGDIIILAKKNAGKTVTGKDIVEDLLAQGEQVIAIDPLSVWWGLKSSRDGKSEGFPVAIFGGPRADIPLSLDAAVPIAATLVDNNLSAVLDLSEWVEEEQSLFLVDFLSEVYQKNKKPIWIVLEEAHEFAPQNANSSQQNACLAMVRRIAKGGRSKGIRLIAITQRNAELHKSIVSGASTLIAMKTTSPLDQAPILKWFQGNASKDFSEKVKSNLGRLKRGEAFVGASDQHFFERVQFPLNGTFDSSFTPVRGQTRDEPTTLAQIDISAITAALAPKDEGKSSDAAPTSDTLEAEYKRGFKAGLEKSENDINDIRESAYLGGLNHSAQRLRQLADELAGAEELKIEVGGLPLSSFAGHPANKVDVLPDEDQIYPGVNAALVTHKFTDAVPRRAIISAKERPQKWTKKSTSSKPNPLVAAAEAVWPAKLTWAALCATSGRKARGGHFNTQRKKALESGQIREDGNLVILTDPPDIGGAIPADLLSRKLPKPANLMFDYIRAHGAESWEDCADGIGITPSGGYFNTGRSILLKSEIIRAVPGHGLCISPELLRGG